VTLVVRGQRVVLPDGVRPAAIHVRNGTIDAIGSFADRPAGVRTIDADDAIVLPGLVDTHVHINDPGRTDWEGVESATRAAVAGGVTTVVDMPLNSIPSTTTVAALEAKLEATRGRSLADLAFWGGVVPGNGGDLAPLAAAGVRGFKAFLAPSGVDEFAHVSEEDLRGVLPALARLRVPLLVHAELPAFLCAPDARADPLEYGTWLASRPPASERAAIDLLIRLAREYGAHIHVVHLAAADALDDLRAARAAGVPLTVETCPHYLTFAAEEIPRGSPAFKCAPPIRERAQRERLWDGLRAGDIDLVASDHSPAPPALKHLDDGDLLRAWGGIASLQVGLAVVWTGAAARGFSVAEVLRWMAAAPARLAGLDRVKGSIAPGCDADLVIWDPDAEAEVDPAALFHRHPITPYAGRRLRGRVQTTLLRGEIVFEHGSFPQAPRGRHLLGGTAGC
jgi:allantoinase